MTYFHNSIIQFFNGIGHALFGDTKAAIAKIRLGDYRKIDLEIENIVLGFTKNASATGISISLAYTTNQDLSNSRTDIADLSRYKEYQAFQKSRNVQFFSCQIIKPFVAKISTKSILCFCFRRSL